MTNGLRPYPISLDNYFVDREDTPRDENGNYDYESLYARPRAFQQPVASLASGRRSGTAPVQLHVRQKEYKGDKLRIDKHTILILEGIHA